MRSGRRPRLTSLKCRGYLPESVPVFEPLWIQAVAWDMLHACSLFFTTHLFFRHEEDMRIFRTTITAADIGRGRVYTHLLNIFSPLCRRELLRVAESPPGRTMVVAFGSIGPA